MKLQKDFGVFLLGGEKEFRLLDGAIILVTTICTRNLIYVNTFSQKKLVIFYFNHAINRVFIQKFRFDVL